MKPVLVSHPTGNSFVRALLQGLQERGLLDSFHTTIGFSSAQNMSALLPGSLRKQLERRNFDLPAEKIHTHPARESVRLILQTLGLPSTSMFSADAIYQSLDRHVASCPAIESSPPVLGGLYCYEDGALETFRAAKKFGLHCFYELPIAYWKKSRELLSQEAERLPEWRATLLAPDDPPEKLKRKDEELALADLVICPSSFVLDSLPENIRKKVPCVVAPFGSPASAPPRARDVGTGEKLRVLFAGSMSQRKGLADVFAAMKILNNPEIELVVLGHPIAPMNFYRSHFSDFIWENPRPQSEVFALMSTCDVLVLPSIIEGRALVQQEAMMCGLPIIVTENAGGGDLVVPGETGFLLPIRNPEAIAEAVHWCNINRAHLKVMGERARACAEQYTWSAYSDKIISALVTIAHV